MRFNIKSKKGFTLIELLVVIGILAVLAAIAIPSVAGLIDRANVSSDNTNANEYTNAIERFASEYELYCQDIASGTFNINDMDAAQSRVYNITQITSRIDIEHIEKNQDVDIVDTYSDVAIYRDTKYPVNSATLRAIIKNYTKTSSSSFEPKQSDCCYYYAPTCGVVVCTERNNARVVDLNELIISGKDAKGNELNEDTPWINLTTGYKVGYEPFDLGLVNSVLEKNDWSTIHEVIQAGKAKEAGWRVGDTKTMQINGANVKVMIIGINHDGENTVTFMAMNSIGNHHMNPSITNVGGWEASACRTWLNSDVLNSMENKEYIKQVMKKSNNVGRNGTTSTSTFDNIFLISAKEMNRQHEYALTDEGSPYEYFANGGTIDAHFWLRTASTFSGNKNNFLYQHQTGILANSARIEYPIHPAFVIG